MSAARDIREKYSLTQPQLADYLGISRTMLAMIETGKRSFSLGALKKLNMLGMSYEQNAAGKSRQPNTTAPVKEQAALRRSVKKRLSEMNRKADLLQHKLDAMSATYQAQLLQSAGIQKILNRNDKNETGKQQLLHIQLHETNTRLAKCQPIQQALLSIKLQSLRLEISLLDKLLQIPANKIIASMQH